MATGMCVVRHTCTSITLQNQRSHRCLLYGQRCDTWYLVLVAEYNCGTAFHCLYLYSYLPLSLSSLIFMKC